jgi:hypothetical protein
MHLWSQSLNPNYRFISAITWLGTTNRWREKSTASLIISPTISPISHFLLRLPKFVASYVPSTLSLSISLRNCFIFVINFSIVPIRMLNYLRLLKKMMKYWMLLTTKELSFSSSQLFILLPLSLSLLILISSLKSRIVRILP